MKTKLEIIIIHQSRSMDNGYFVDCGYIMGFVDTSTKKHVDMDLVKQNPSEYEFTNPEDVYKIGKENYLKPYLP